MAIREIYKRRRGTVCAYIGATQCYGKGGMTTFYFGVDCRDIDERAGVYWFKRKKDATIFAEWIEANPGGNFCIEYMTAGFPDEYGRHCGIKDADGYNMENDDWTEAVPQHEGVMGWFDQK